MSEIHKRDEKCLDFIGNSAGPSGRESHGRDQQQWFPGSKALIRANEEMAISVKRTLLTQSIMAFLLSTRALGGHCSSKSNK